MQSFIIPMKMKKKNHYYLSLSLREKKHLFERVDFLINSIVFYYDHFVFGIESDELPSN
jgi:hypothetical protein